MENEQAVGETISETPVESGLFGTPTESITTPAETPSATPEAKPEITEVPKAEPEKKVAQKPRMLEDLQRERARRRNLEAELQEIKGLLKNSSVVADPDVKKIQEELGVDEDSARKLNSVINDKLKKAVPQVKDVYAEESANFSEEANIVSQGYGDWDNHRPVMEKLFLEQANVNPQLALQRGPEYYYLKAKSLRPSDIDSARAEGRREIAQKINEKNVAQSGSNTPTPKPVPDGRDLGSKLRDMAPSEFARRYKENPNPSQWKI